MGASRGQRRCEITLCRPLMWRSCAAYIPLGRRSSAPHGPTSTDRATYGCRSHAALGPLACGSSVACAALAHRTGPVRPLPGAARAPLGHLSRATQAPGHCSGAALRFVHATRAPLARRSGAVWVHLARRSYAAPARLARRSRAARTPLGRRPGAAREPPCRSDADRAPHRHAIQV